ncbi:hypothetical protein B6L66_09775 [Salmonella enterica subsp. enterica serovar Montevideo]|nr:hypothetical protein [Salmonella enterica subsp. enterica serovar Montevideo]
MKEITVTEPAFVTRFSCSGSACRDHCCKGWKITLDNPAIDSPTRGTQSRQRKLPFLIPEPV